MKWVPPRYNRSLDPISLQSRHAVTSSLPGQLLAQVMVSEEIEKLKLQSLDIIVTFLLRLCEDS